MDKIGQYLYHFIEKINGEKGKKILPYKVSQYIKIFILIYLIKG